MPSDLGLVARLARLAVLHVGWAWVLLGSLVVLVSGTAGQVFGPAIGVLILAAAALVLAIAAMWSSLRALVGDSRLSPEDAFLLGAPSTEEEQKRAVLRAIKDIEFERTVGKISEEDYLALVGRYRAEAKRLLRQIEDRAAPERERAERLANERLVAAGVVEARPENGDLRAPKQKKKKKRAETPKRSCEACGATNDLDAAFCKACGNAILAKTEAP